jgi:Ca2+-binding RTX toxin-like protein
MRRIAMLLAMAVALLALGAGAVFAQVEQPGTAEDEGSGQLEGAVFTGSSNQTIQCTGVPCVATGNDDLIYERVGNRKKDRILLKGGDDQVRANTYGKDKDVIKGHSGFDLIYVDDGDTRDRIFGGKGNDKCYVDARSEVVSGCSVIIVQ